MEVIDATVYHCEIKEFIIRFVFEKIGALLKQ